ncbi:MAG: SAM-dependent methyltransferase [Chromatiales bacterium 21-64-14]|nr:MAG: SAM-dependent methyltransferase [Chromatiales bacterium 21-64-14]HQU15792.1 class I SAM-dependent methyltransferase [Gammaproteobacteria bacterium]
MDSTFWDGRYEGPGYCYGTEPNDFLVAQAGQLRTGMRALAVGDGEGRNGVWLAQQGLDVLAVDYSAQGLRKTRALAAARGVRLTTEHADLASWNWPESAFDVVAALFVHLPPAVRARVHHAMLAALKPGGLLILEAFHPAQLQLSSGGPPAAELLYTQALLAADFTRAGDLRLIETRRELAEGTGHRGPAAVVQLLARRATR